MFSRYEIRLSGTGGQGLILAGMILAEAIAFGEKKQVVQSQNYGPEARGTNSRSDIIISDQEIDYPKALHLDALLALNQAALDENFPALKEGGLLLVDSDLVKEVPPVPYLGLPLTRLAQRERRSPPIGQHGGFGRLGRFDRAGIPAITGGRRSPLF